MLKTPQYGSRRPASLKASLTGIRNKRSGTRPERLLISALRKLGILAHSSKKRVLGSPDLVFWKNQLAVFCDGDFWHGRNWRQGRRRLEDGSNPGYWVKKIEYNRQRDKRNTTLLKQAGWNVLRIWESDLLRNPIGAAFQVASFISMPSKAQLSSRCNQTDTSQEEA